MAAEIEGVNADLLKSLKEMVRHFQSYHPLDGSEMDMIRRAKAAIAKAESGDVGK